MNDIPPQNSAFQGNLRPFAEFLLALSFLTRLPVPFLRTIDMPPLATAMRLFPVAGLVVGAITGLVLVAGKLAGVPALLAGAAALAVTALATGALHEDGLADVADGFGGGQSAEQRLEIMRDSRIGAYGTIALIIAFLARAAILEELYYRSPTAIVLVLMAAAAFSRALMVDLLWATRPARSDGLSVFAGRPAKGDALIALASGGGIALLAIAYSLSLQTAIFALVAGGLGLGLVRTIAMRKIGGQTGDVCGAAQVISEIAILGTAISMIG